MGGSARQAGNSEQQKSGQSAGFGVWCRRLERRGGRGGGARSRGVAAARQRCTNINSSSYEAAPRQTRLLDIHHNRLHPSLAPFHARRRSADLPRPPNRRRQRADIVQACPLRTPSLFLFLACPLPSNKHHRLPSLHHHHDGWAWQLEVSLSQRSYHREKASRGPRVRGRAEQGL